MATTEGIGLTVRTINNKVVTSHTREFAISNMDDIRANLNPDGTGTPQINIPGETQFRYQEIRGNSTNHWNKYTVDETVTEIARLITPDQQ